MNGNRMPTCFMHGIKGQDTGDKSAMRKNIS